MTIEMAGENSKPQHDISSKPQHDISSKLQHGISSKPQQDMPHLMKPIPREIRNLFAGGIAGMVAKSTVAPIDRIKILYQVTNNRFRLRNVPLVASHIIKQEGFFALWKGNSATMLRVFPYAGIQFMVFDRCKVYMLQNRKERIGESLNPLESLCAGSLAGAISVTFTYPLDLVRAQLAVQSNKGSRLSSFSESLTLNYKSSVSFTVSSWSLNLKCSSWRII